MKKEYVAPKLEQVYPFENICNDLGDASGNIGGGNLVPEDGWD